MPSDDLFLYVSCSGLDPANEYHIGDDEAHFKNYCERTARSGSLQGYAPRLRMMMEKAGLHEHIKILEEVLNNFSPKARL